MKNIVIWLGVLAACIASAPGGLAQAQGQPRVPLPGDTRMQAPMEPMPPATGPTAPITPITPITPKRPSGPIIPDAPPLSEPGITTPRVETSGGTGMQSEAGVDAAAAAANDTRPKPRTRHDVTYLCGGIGREEAAYMKRQARGYDLMLIFATRDGAYLADVNVELRDAAGNSVLQTRCDSPMLLVDLPRGGNYRVVAEAAGYRLDRTARIAAKKRKSAHAASLVMTWPRQAVQPAASTSKEGVPAGTDNGSGP